MMRPDMYGAQYPATMAGQPEPRSAGGDQPPNPGVSTGQEPGDPDGEEPSAARKAWPWIPWSA